jgi:ribosomal protein L40E
MQLRKLLACLLIGVVLVLVIVPSAHAQTTSVTIVAAPSQAPLQSDGTAQFDVTAQITAVGIPKSTFQQSGSGDYDVLVVGLGFTKDEASPNLSITGSAVAASPSFCLPTKITGQKPGDTICYILPFCQFASSCTTETDDITFHATLSNARAQQYHFEVMALFILQTPQAGNNLGAPVGGPQGSSWNTADFYVPVANQAQSTTSVTSYTPFTSTTPVTSSAATPSLQMPQPPQPTATQSNNTPKLVLALAVIAVVLLGVVFLYSRRKEQSTKAEKIELKTEEAASGKNFCIECGNKLPLKSKFCNNCGTKQP